MLPLIFISIQKRMEVKIVGYNHAKEERKFWIRWTEKKSMYMKAGMTEEQINQIYEYERLEFNSDRSFFEHTVSSSEINYSFALSYQENFLFSDWDSWMQLLPEDTYKKLCKLSEEHLKAFTLHRLYGYTQQEISSILLKPQQTISYWISRIAEILEKSK